MVTIFFPGGEIHQGQNSTNVIVYRHFSNEKTAITRPGESQSCSCKIYPNPLNKLHSSLKEKTFFFRILLRRFAVLSMPQRLSPMLR